MLLVGGFRPLRTRWLDDEAGFEILIHATQARKLLKKMKAKRVLGDRGYVGNDIRQAIIETGAKPVIPPKKNARFIHPYSRKIYKERNVIERMINRLKHFRRFATRFEKNAINFLAMVTLASIQLWLR